MLPLPWSAYHDLAGLTLPAGLLQPPPEPHSTPRIELSKLLPLITMKLRQLSARRAVGLAARKTRSNLLRRTQRLFRQVLRILPILQRRSLNERTKEWFRRITRNLSWSHLAYTCQASSPPYDNTLAPSTPPLVPPGTRPSRVPSPAAPRPPALVREELQPLLQQLRPTLHLQPLEEKL